MSLKLRVEDYAGQNCEVQLGPLDLDGEFQNVYAPRPQIPSQKLGPPAIGALLSRFIFVWEGSPSKIDYGRKGTLILSSLLEDLVKVCYAHGPSLPTPACLFLFLVFNWGRPF